MKILVIADIHGNAEALKAVLDAERDADSTVFLGDTVSPGPQANETVALFENLSGTFIIGNHDLEVLEPERVSGWPEEWRAFNDWVLETLDPAGVDFLRELLPAGDYRVGDLDLCLHHGELEGERPRHAIPDTADTRLQSMANNSKAPVVLFGHSHVQFGREVAGRKFINPGSVGQNRCGKVLACYGVFIDGVFEHRQVPFDPAPWLDAMDRVTPLDAYPDFREWLKNGLLTGYGIGETEPWTRLAAEGYC